MKKPCKGVLLIDRSILLQRSRETHFMGGMRHPDFKQPQWQISQISVEIIDSHLLDIQITKTGTGGGVEISKLSYSGSYIIEW